MKLISGARYLLLALSVLYIANWITTASTLFNQPDHSVYYAWSWAMRHGINPYAADLEPLARHLGLDIGRFHTANYPPLFILGFAPLTWLTPQASWWVWTVINASALIASLMLLLRRSALSHESAVLFVAATFFYYPLAFHFYWAQPQLIVLLMLVACNELMRVGRDAGAGAVLGLAILLKIFPLVLVGYLAMTRRWRALLSVSATVVAGLALSLIVLGPAALRPLVDSLMGMSKGNWLVANNLIISQNLIAVGPVISRLFYLSGNMDSLLRPLCVALAELAILGASVRVTAMTCAHDERAFGVWICAMILLSPLAWVHYMVLLLFPFVMLASAFARASASLRALIAGAASYTLTNLWPVIYGPVERIMPIGIFAWLSWAFFPAMTVLAFVSTLWLIADTPAPLARESLTAPAA